MMKYRSFWRPLKNYFGIMKYRNFFIMELLHYMLYSHEQLYILLRGVENRLIRRNIFFMYITNVFYLFFYSETKNKVEKERRQAYPFSSSMICSVVHEAKRGREKKKKKTARNGIASQPLSTIYPSQLALNSWSELWVTLPVTCPALRTSGETLVK